MEDRAEDPSRDAEAGEQLVVLAERVGGWDSLTDLGQAVLVRDQVPQAKEHREGLLHTEDAYEGPFSVELGDGLPSSETLLRYYVLACVVALLRAGPE